MCEFCKKNIEVKLKIMVQQRFGECVLLLQDETYHPVKTEILYKSRQKTEVLDYLVKILTNINTRFFDVCCERVGLANPSYTYTMRYLPEGCNYEEFLMTIKTGGYQ